MSVTRSDLDYDPYNTEIYNNPYPVFRRLREEAPLYYNEAYDFYAVSRFVDVERVFVERETFLSCRGDVLELIKSGVEIPRGTLIFEDQPVHGIHRGLLSRVFTPKRMNALEPKVREFCRRRLDLLTDATTFDFVADVAAQVPMRVIGMLLGIPEGDQETVRDHVNDGSHPEPGKPHDYSEGFPSGDIYADYIDWRYSHRSDDLMTELITTEFEDENGAIRPLTRDEVLAYVVVLAGAGNETTNRLIGWTGQLLGDHSGARRELVEDRSLIPNAIEEILRFESPSYRVARYVGRDVELYGQKVPEGSAIVCLPGSANRDHRQFPDGDRFDIHRSMGHHLSFGYGVHYCLGAALARLEGRVVLDEVLNRFTDWEVDHENARLGGHVRGWDTLPVEIT